MRWTLCFCLLAAAMAAFADDPTYGISSNPGAVNIMVGTGALGRRLKIPESSGVRLGGFWMCDGNPVLSGTDKKQFTGNNLLILDFSVDLGKAMHWKGGYFGTEFLQFNGQKTNIDAGVAQGFNSITGDPPLNRSELYQLWLLQKFCDGKFSIRVGKTAPIYHFNNVSKPVPTENAVVSIPSVSGLIFTPLFVNTTLLGAIGGYYNSVYGVVATIAPIKEAYINVGVFDGNLAKGVQTGLTGPHFNGYYFSIMEAGYGWASAKPGIVAIGGWYQSGRLENAGQVQTGTGGCYFFGSQALWIKESHTVSKGNLSGFMQFGWSNARTLPMNLYIGGGLSGFALIPKRPNDSFGMGIAWSRLNRHVFQRYSELMLQAYYQMAICNSVFFEPVLSYIPTPGGDANHANVCAITARLTVLF